MTLGEKIKSARKAKRITQRELAKDKLTRNMISRIESGTATPSLDTIKYVANELKLPVKFIGVGEGIDDLQPFNPSAFAKALFENTAETVKEDD